jgi:phosphohistidine phosphatase
MPRRLLLIRHAKSSWDEPSLADRDRPLTDRGLRAAERMGHHLRDEGLVPELVWCSTARRTRETLERLALPDGEVRFEEELYGADADELLVRIRTAPETTTSLAVIAHNPGLHDLAVGLSASEPRAAASRLRVKLPTGALVVFRVDPPWADIEPGRVRLASFVTPKELP